MRYIKTKYKSNINYVKIVKKCNNFKKGHFLANIYTKTEILVIGLKKLSTLQKTKGEEK